MPVAEVDELLAKVDAVVVAAERFGAEMRRQGIHIGLGRGIVVMCVVCGKPWPCEQETGT